MRGVSPLRRGERAFLKFMTTAGVPGRWFSFEPLPSRFKGVFPPLREPLRDDWIGVPNLRLQCRLENSERTGSRKRRGVCKNNNEKGGLYTTDNTRARVCVCMCVHVCVHVSGRWWAGQLASWPKDCCHIARMYVWITRT